MRKVRSMPRLSLTGCLWHQLEYSFVAQIPLALIREAVVHEVSAEDLLKEMLHPIHSTGFYIHLGISPKVCRDQMVELLRFRMDANLGGGSHLKILESIELSHGGGVLILQRAHYEKCTPCRNYVGWIRTLKPAYEEFEQIEL